MAGKRDYGPVFPPFAYAPYRRAALRHLRHAATKARHRDNRHATTRDGGRGRSLRVRPAEPARGRGYHDSARDAGPMRSRLWRDIAAKRSTSTSCGARYRPTTRPAYGSSQRPDMRSAAAAATGFLRPKAGATRYYYRKSCSRRYKICGRYTCRILFCIFLITS